MKTNYTFNFFALLPLFFFCGNIIAQKSEANKPLWTANPFDQKVFIESKGQFTSPLSPLSSRRDSFGAGRGVGVPAAGRGEAKFGASIDGLELFFSARGLTYKHTEFVRMKKEREEEQEENEHKIKVVPYYLSMEWVGSNPNVENISEEPVSCYFTYPDLNDVSGNST